MNYKTNFFYQTKLFCMIFLLLTVSFLPCFAASKTNKVTQAEQLEAIADQIKKDLPIYDSDTYQLSSALKAGKADCLALSLYEKLACDGNGIDCDLILGMKDPSSLSEGMHMWCRVKLNGDWYWSDVSAHILNYGIKWTHSPTIADQISQYSYFYVIDPLAGTYKELEKLTLTAVGIVPIHRSNAARQIAQLEKTEYESCQSEVSKKITTCLKNISAKSETASDSSNNSGATSSASTSNLKLKKAKITKLTYNKKTKKAVIAYKKQKKATGYEIKYSTSKKFAAKKTKSYKTTKVKKTFKKLKTGKTYYFKVRAYKKNGDKSKKYGKWSTVKKIHT